MTRITIITEIDAPLANVFDLARDAAFHVETARQSGERIVTGRKKGLFELGDEATFEGKHLGVRQRFSVRIVAMNSPHFFADEMTRGIFSQFRHDHHFLSLCNGQTRMTDRLFWRSPLGILGVCADQIAVRRHLHHFLSMRVAQIKIKAEAKP